MKESYREGEKGEKVRYLFSPRFFPPPPRKAADLEKQVRATSLPTSARISLDLPSGAGYCYGVDQRGNADSRIPESLRLSPCHDPRFWVLIGDLGIGTRVRYCASPCSPVACYGAVCRVPWSP